MFMRFSVPDVFRALSDRHRLKILELLRPGSRTAGEIAQRFRMTQPAVSHHLAVLRRAGVVTAEKRGKEVYYSLNGCCLQECCGRLFLKVGLEPLTKKEA
jgi:ArsR family transcriptional regulator, arsenate/arsenite/antimonite-responsive transcriptional repressor